MAIDRKVRLLAGHNAWFQFQGISPDYAHQSSCYRPRGLPYTVWGKACRKGSDA